MRLYTAPKVLAGVVTRAQALSLLRSQCTRLQVLTIPLHTGPNWARQMNVGAYQADHFRI